MGYFHAIELVKDRAAPEVASHRDLGSFHLLSGRTVRVSALTRPSEAWSLGGGVVSTAAPAAALVRLLARGRIEAVGVHPPETCIEPDDLFPELEQRGCRFEMT